MSKPKRGGSLGVDPVRSLRLRALVLVLLAFATVSVPAGLCFVWLLERTTVSLATFFAEKQVLYDRSRGLEALSRESALAETLARSPTLIAWAADEADPEKAARGLAELEHYRRAFRDRSYFFVVGQSGNYYFNDSAETFTGTQRRYTLSPDNPRDAWYYKTAASGSGCHLNVDHDRGVGVTNVWFNCVVRDGDRTVGIVGTGINLTSFIREVANSAQPGVETMFVDPTGAVQATRDESEIDFRSVTKAVAERKTVFRILSQPTERAALAAMMGTVSREGRRVEVRLLEVEGRPMLVGVGYLDQLGWYNVTFMDTDRIIDKSLFWPIGGLFAALILGSAGVISYLFRRRVLDRLAGAEQTLARLEAGDFSTPATDRRRDEIGRLSAALSRMALAVQDNTAKLEDAVRERTEQLRRVACLDPLTGIFNRRGFADAFAHRDASRAFGLLLLDIDKFKAINDTRGHGAGDAVICELARRVEAALAETDVCARWGGDEFVVLVRVGAAETLARRAAAILAAIRATNFTLPDGARLRLTTSIGGHEITAGDTLDVAAQQADLALYAAKRAGRNRIVIGGATPGAPEAVQVA